MRDALKPEPFQSWDDFRFFLATSKTGSFSKAASELGVTQPTISRRIEGLESRLSVRLFDRLPSGVSLTAEGERILDAARHIEKSVIEIQRSVLGSDKRLEGPVRISVTDGLATYVLTPHLAEFQEEYPGISLEVLCSLEPADVLYMESDLAFRYRRPEEPDLIAVRLGTLHFVPWASPGYLERFGAPAAPEELLHHRLIDHMAYYDDDGDWSAWFALARAANLITYRTNVSSTFLSAIRSGLGIGFLPTYSCTRVPDIVPLDLGLRTNSPIWLTYHSNVRNTARVRAVVTWVRHLFEKQSWPWFADEFHPPWASSPDTRPEAE